MTGSLTFLGTATTLVEYGGLTVLTDPNFLHKGDYAYLGKGLVSKRPAGPAMRGGGLPRGGAGRPAPPAPNCLHKGDYASLAKGLVSKRLTEPAMRVEDLPRLDAVVLS